MHTTMIVKRNEVYASARWTIVVRTTNISQGVSRACYMPNRQRSATKAVGRSVKVGHWFVPTECFSRLGDVRTCTNLCNIPYPSVRGDQSGDMRGDVLACVYKGGIFLAIYIVCPYSTIAFSSYGAQPIKPRIAGSITPPRRTTRLMTTSCRG
jgi:hypothetical protein